MIIYKILREEEFLVLEKDKHSSGSSIDNSDGFIHLSKREQLSETLKKYFHNEKNLILMAIETQKVGYNLKWEKTRHNQLFPHLYSNLYFNDALWFAPIELIKGQHIIPEGTKKN